MALALEDSSLVKQKVTNALQDAHPVIQNAFNDVLKFLATQGGKPTLEFIPFAEADCDAAGGTVKADAACKIYGVYVKKVSAATDNYFKIYDDATDDTTAGDQIIALPLLATTEAVFEVHPAGLAMGTGIVVTQHTTSIGVTDGSDGGNGFIIIGAA